MGKKMDELKRKIEQKNLALSAINWGDSSKDEKTRKIEMELDYLLYQYFKMLKCS